MPESIAFRTSNAREAINARICKMKWKTTIINIMAMINDKSISGDKQTNRNENEMKLLTKRRGLSGNNFTTRFVGEKSRNVVNLRTKSAGSNKNFFKN